MLIPTTYFTHTMALNKVSPVLATSVIEFLEKVYLAKPTAIEGKASGMPNSPNGQILQRVFD